MEKCNVSTLNQSVWSILWYIFSLSFRVDFYQADHRDKIDLTSIIQKLKCDFFVSIWSYPIKTLAAVAMTKTYTSP